MADFRIDLERAFDGGGHGLSDHGLVALSQPMDPDPDGPLAQTE